MVQKSICSKIDINLCQFSCNNETLSLSSSQSTSDILETTLSKTLKFWCNFFIVSLYFINSQATMASTQSRLKNLLAWSPSFEAPPLSFALDTWSRTSLFSSPSNVWTFPLVMFPLVTFANSYVFVNDNSFFYPALIGLVAMIKYFEKPAQNIQIWNEDTYGELVKWMQWFLGQSIAVLVISLFLFNFTISYVYELFI